MMLQSTACLDLRAIAPHFQAMTAKVEIYTKFACPFCFRAKLLLEAKGVEYDEIDAMGGSGRENMLARANGRTTVPQIFIDGFHVGGSDDLQALDAAGKLEPMLAGSVAQ
jgi:glutaredoxin 3